MKKIIFFVVLFNVLFFHGFAFAEDEKFLYMFKKDYFASEIADTVVVEVSDFDYDFANSTKSRYLEIWNDAKEGEEISNKVKTKDNRTAALALGRGIVEYKLQLHNYNLNEMHSPYILARQLDGISNEIYNLAYLFSIPEKLIHAPIYALSEGYGVVEVAKIVISLAVGFVLAMIMGAVGGLIGTFINPLQTLANLVVSFSDPIDTNTIVSGYDVTVGAIFAPLADIFLLFF